MNTYQSYIVGNILYTIKYSKTSRHYSISRDGGKYARTNQEAIRAALGPTPNPVSNAGLMLVTGQLNAAFRASTILQGMRDTKSTINVAAHITRVLANIKRLTQLKALIRANLNVQQGVL